MLTTIYTSHRQSVHQIFLPGSQSVYDFNRIRQNVVNFQKFGEGERPGPRIVDQIWMLALVYPFRFFWKV